MSELLDEVLAAHGGLARWRTVTTVRARGTFGGRLGARFPGNRLRHFDVRVEPAAQRAVFEGFPGAGRRAVFDRGDVRVETSGGEVVASRVRAREAFGGLRRQVRWDALCATYFAGYAFWNYLAMPLVLAGPGVEVRDLPGRRLAVRFPPGVHTHSPEQTFHVTPDGLVWRHDYTAEPVGRWARAAHLCGAHRAVDGLVFATRRRVHPRGAPWPTLVALDLDELEVATS